MIFCTSWRSSAGRHPVRYTRQMGSSFRPNFLGYETESKPQMWQGAAKGFSLPAPTAVGAVTGKQLPDRMINFTPQLFDCRFYHARINSSQNAER